MALFDAVLIIATLLCGLVSGFLLAFAIVVMPGIARLDDAAFLKAFQAIDGVIQKGQPLFGLMWLGSVVAVLAAAVVGWWSLAGVDRALVIAAALVWALGVQLPTFRINIPLNNRVQRSQIARAEFEPRWNRWNAIRTALAVLATVLLLLAL